MFPMNPSINKNSEKLFGDLRNEMATLNSAINALKFCYGTVSKTEWYPILSDINELCEILANKEMIKWVYG